MYKIFYKIIDTAHTVIGTETAYYYWFTSFRMAYCHNKSHRLTVFAETVVLLKPRKYRDFLL